MSDAVAVMNEGRFEQIGAPRELYERPASSFGAGFVGESNRWSGRVEQLSGDTASIALDGGGSVRATRRDSGVTEGSRVEVFVRPEAITLEGGADGATLPGRVDSLLFNGENSRVLVRTRADQLVEVNHPPGGEVAEGDPVDIGWPHGRALCFESRA